jgi:DNA repair exonuclease SbcCD ATPase subunit
MPKDSARKETKARNREQSASNQSEENVNEVDLDVHQEAADQTPTAPVRDESPEEQVVAETTADDRAADFAASEAPDTAEIDEVFADESKSGGAVPPASGAFAETLFDERNDVLGVINELEDQLDRYQGIRESLEADLAEKTESLQNAQQKIQELEWQVVTVNTKVEALEQLKNEINLLEEEMEDANSRIQRLNEQLTSSDKENSRLASELKGANKQLEELWSVRKDRDGLRSDLKTANGKIETMEREMREIVDARGVLQDKLRDQEIVLDDTKKARAQLELDLRASNDRNRESLAVQQELEERVETLRGDKKTLQLQIAHLERENNRLNEQRQFYECELASMRNQNRNAETALASVKKAFAEVRVALSETKARVRRRGISTSSGTLRTRTIAEGDLTIDPRLIEAFEDDEFTSGSGRNAAAGKEAQSSVHSD